MKLEYSHIGLVKLCGWFGITRQAYYQYGWRSIDTSIEEYLILKEIGVIRKKHPRMGVRKLYVLLEEFMLESQIKLGRDALFDLLRVNNLLVRKRRNRTITTNSFHWLRKYPNLIRDLCPKEANELWVSDITYWKIKERYLYISLITDVFSHKVVGYSVGKTLEAKHSMRALEMALLTLAGPINLIHHSDRGVQYCSSKYVELLQEYNVNISMTENGDPLENAVAERINGILKDEYLSDYQVENIKEAKEVLDYVIELYNNERPHMSIGNLPPEFVHQNNVQTEKLWKNYYKKKTNIVNSLQDQQINVNLNQD